MGSFIPYHRVGKWKLQDQAKHCYRQPFPSTSPINVEIPRCNCFDQGGYIHKGIIFVALRGTETIKPQNNELRGLPARDLRTTGCPVLSRPPAYVHLL